MATPINELAINIAVQTIIVLIGLSASIITFTSTFAQSSKQRKVSCLEKWAWVVMGISIAFGIIALLKIIGNIDSGQAKIYATWTCIFAGVQIISFALGLLFLIVMAWQKNNISK